MKVLISGYYGFGNIGDEAVLQAIVQGLKANNPDMDITVLSASPKITAAFYQVKTLPRSNFGQLLQAMGSCDVFISGGGTLFQNSTSNRSFLYYIGLIILVKIFRKKTMVFAQGFGPLKGKFNNFIVCWGLKRVDLITLRDQEAFDKLRELGVTNEKIFVTADPAVLLPAPSSAAGRKILSLEAVHLGRPLLGISVRDLPGKDGEKLYKSLAQTIDWLVTTYDYSPVFILFACPEDMEETAKVINYMREKSNIIYRICRPDEMLALIASFDLLIAMRLHALIFAAMSETPLLGISYDPKVTAFMKLINQPYFQISDNLNFACLKLILTKIVDNKTRIKEQLRQAGGELRQQAALNFELFNEI
ncbi:polysaccharide pyruvyl transferase CsaB [Candidatus Saganbacteria bacterium]|nr:polysaccharide pyruvyl transferase CsaB [Candidatus Saganbacteria bacterium]